MRRGAGPRVACRGDGSPRCVPPLRRACRNTWDIVFGTDSLYRCAAADAAVQGPAAPGRALPAAAAGLGPPLLPSPTALRRLRPSCAAACSTGGSMAVGLLIMVLIRYFNLPLVEGLPGG